jgi:predicted phosphoadenosine phosphosulfate sulfurtransferase
VLDSNGKIVFTNDWKLRYHGTDSGQYASDQAQPPFTTTWGKYTEFRLDNAPNTTKAFYASLREIQRP